MVLGRKKESVVHQIDPRPEVVDPPKSTKWRLPAQGCPPLLDDGISQSTTPHPGVAVLGASYRRPISGKFMALMLRLFWQFPHGERLIYNNISNKISGGEP